ncbi:S8 family peptidase [Modestobacter versicolor]|uniref:Peptidase S8 n=1 Tax=Modestobacter versicolor TaxID=429133 RepID=A0A323VF18_9ACTN|nr:S8 family serine peptidase [Modestobacter versicolor]MBB3676310.1 subtilisin family serine protease [Modestobacter versicolor]PZA22770.1 peptidase S8 [Modestobacter versicolor]
MWSHRAGRSSSRRTIGVLAVAATAVVASAPAATADERVPTAEYVVAFTGSPEAAAASVQAAGGTVQDVTEQVGVALVTSDSASFLADVRARDGVAGAARNHAVGTSDPGMPHRYADERPSAADRAGGGGRGHGGHPWGHGPASEPLAELQWNMEMIGATPDAAHRRATGKGVDVGIMDTGIDAGHPDLARNVDAARSRNFTTDIPDIDGPCEVAPSCVDPADVDDEGHGTHVAGIVAADDNGFGIGGVAPDATLVNVRAGQDSGYFFLYETVAALVYSAEIRLDVVNMSFYTDPWLYNCTSRDEYLEGTVTDDELAEQRLVRELLTGALGYASARGVTLVGSAGNESTNLAAPTRTDETSPDYPPDAAQPRVVANTCMNLPSEGPNVISVSAVGPSTTKADYSNYGLGDVEIAAPGGWYRDLVGTPAYMTAGNLVLSSYPLRAAIEQGLATPDGQPVDDMSVRYCDAAGVCGFYSYLQGTSMAAPHVAGVAALVIDEFGRPTRHGGRALAPAIVAQVLARTAEDHPCPAGGVEDYTDEERDPAVFNAVCEGTTDVNGLYGEGIVDAAAAVGGR